MLARPVVACSKVALLASTTVSIVPISVSTAALISSAIPSSVAIAAISAVNAPASGITSTIALIAAISVSTAARIALICFTIKAPEPNTVLIVDQVSTNRYLTPSPPTAASR